MSHASIYAAYGSPHTLCAVPRTRSVRATFRGFTLMEMLVVVTIIIILLAATLPRVKYAIEESKLRESSRQFSSYISMAKSRAATTGRPCGIYLVSEKLDAQGVYPGTYQATQLYLAEVPPSYSGDTLNAHVFITNVGGGLPLNAAPPWEINPVNSATMATLQLLVDLSEPFAIQLDHKGPIFGAQRDSNANRYYITSSSLQSNNLYVHPPTATGTWDPNNPNVNPNAGYTYDIYRNPRRIGDPLALPRGTAIDLGYSGFGNSGTDFAFCGTPANTPPGFVLVMFAPSGRVTNVIYEVYDNSNGNQGNALFPFRTVNIDAPGTVHFLVGRPEKVGQVLAQSNLVDNNALWTSIGRLTGSVVSTDNAPILTLPSSTVQEQQIYLTTAREFAITGNPKGER